MSNLEHKILKTPDDYPMLRVRTQDKSEMKVLDKLIDKVGDLLKEQGQPKRRNRIIIDCLRSGLMREIEALGR